MTALLKSNYVESTQRLELESAIGFGGKVTNGLHIHPDGKHILYNLGSSIAIREIGDPRATRFLQGHNDKVSCVAVSPTGRYVASGQTTHMGFQAHVCVFEFETGKLIHRMLLHKVKIQALTFSCDESFLASVGGQDDNTLVVWDLETGRPICGGPASNDLTLCLAFYNNSNKHLISGGNGVLRVWEIDFRTRKINPVDVNVGNIRREFRDIAVEATDKYAYIGTSSGDVVCIQLQGQKNFKMVGPNKKFAGGINCMTLTEEGDILVGCGGGEVAQLSKINLTVQKSVKVQGGVTSVTTMGEHHFIGTDKSNMYYLNSHTFKDELRQTCHFDCVSDIVFPRGYSEVFATCGANDIRIWNASTSQELLRIQVGTLDCNCIQFSKDGRFVVSGWSDGKLRCFGPQSGKLIYVIHDAHKLSGPRKKVNGGKTGVTAICTDNAGEHIITGGADSEVRVWKVSAYTQTMVAAMKEHKGTITALAILHDDSECISASDDGTCILWDLERFVRRNILYSQTYFKAAMYNTDESQILTTGSDRKITYWDSIEVHAIRELEGSKTSEINSFDISADGELFATGGGDKLVKVWDYNEGGCIGVGMGHSSNIQKLKISPDCQRIVSVSEEGAIMIWRLGGGGGGGNGGAGGQPEQQLQLQQQEEDYGLAAPDAAAYEQSQPQQQQQQYDGDEQHVENFSTERNDAVSPQHESVATVQS